MTSLELAAIGNCTVAALVDRLGAIVWSCFPRLDGEPVFCHLLDGTQDITLPRDGVKGQFTVELLDQVKCEQSYLDNTAILVSRMSDSHGNAVEITDFAPRFVQFERLYRPPMLVRRIVPVSGRPRIRMRLRPLFQWGAEEPAITRGSNHVRYVGPEQALRLTTTTPLSYVIEERPFLVDRPVALFFGTDETLRTEADTTAREFLERTRDHWRNWVRSLSIPFEWQEAVIRAAITLKLCNFEETGAIVAALTTSIPEAPGTERNWDYRYCWLRDAYFVINALNRLGETRTMEAFIGFITNVVSDTGFEQLQPLYGISRNPALEERLAPCLAGYRGMGPVRVGNAAYLQQQNDVYGSVVLAATHAFFDKRLIASGHAGLFADLERLGEHAVLAFDQADAGPWELRNTSSVHTFSAVMCWSACDRLAKIASELGLAERTRYWQQHAERIKEVIIARTWNGEIGSFVSTFDGSELDATLLLLQELGFLPASDARIVATVDAVGRHLADGDLLRRYTVEDDFGRPATAFIICAFWYVDALNATGRRDQARALFERILKLRNRFGLFSEDVDARTGELWGNFPQTYSMVGLINSAMRLSKSWERAF